MLSGRYVALAAAGFLCKQICLKLVNTAFLLLKHNSADTLFTSASGKTWGITFEEWLERKKNSNDPRPCEQFT